MHTLENAHVRLTFDDRGRLAGLANGAGDVEIPIDPEALTHAWEVQLRDAAGEVRAVVPSDAPAVRAEPRALTAHWTVSGDWGALAVTATVRLPEDEPLASWTVEVENDTDCALWQVAYPRVSGLAAFPEGGGELAAPRSSGTLTPDPVTVVNHHRAEVSDETRMEYAAFDTEGGANIADSYPGMWAMQFMAYGRPDLGGLYFGVHDSAALYKRFGLYADGKDGAHAALVAKQYPEDRTAPGAGLSSFYPVMVGVYPGPWWNASALYRSWALGQVWCGKGPMRDRTDVAQECKDLDLWYWNYQYLNNSHPRAIVPMIRHLRESLGCNMAFHWYSFNGEMFFRWRVPWGPPDNEDIRYVLLRAVRELHELGVLVIPYLDCRLWSSETRSFQEADGDKWIVRDEKGEGTVWPGLGLAWTMCPTARPFHDLTCTLVHSLIDTCELDGAYLDQVTACNALPCFAENHDHPPGGHDHWVRGYRTLVERVQREIKAKGPTKIVTSEGYIECFMDLFDLDLGYTLGRLRGLTGVAQVMPIPLSQSVYHDYRLTYGTSNKGSDTNMDAFRLSDALVLVGGGQLGICGAFRGDENREPYLPKLEYVKTLVRAHMAGRPWLNLGQWLPPAPVECETMDLVYEEGKPPKQGIPCVLSGSFLHEGEALVVLVNHTDREQTATVTFDPAACGRAPGSAPPLPPAPGSEAARDTGPGPVGLRRIHPQTGVLETKLEKATQKRFTFAPASAHLFVMGACQR